MSLQIKEGTYYRTRDGRKVGNLSETGNSSWPWVDRIAGLWFRGDGYSCPGSLDLHRDEDDIISAWVDEPTSPVRTETRKVIVPGVYGRLHIAPGRSGVGPEIMIAMANRHGLAISSTHTWTLGETRDAIANLTLVADALEQKP